MTPSPTCATHTRCGPPRRRRPAAAEPLPAPPLPVRQHVAAGSRPGQHPAARGVAGPTLYSATCRWGRDVRNEERRQTGVHIKGRRMIPDCLTICLPACLSVCAGQAGAPTSQGAPTSTDVHSCPACLLHSAPPACFLLPPPRRRRRPLVGHPKPTLSSFSAGRRRACTRGAGMPTAAPTPAAAAPPSPVSMAALTPSAPSMATACAASGRTTSRALQERVESEEAGRRRV